jgi:hypothetical protein
MMFYRAINTTNLLFK